MKTKKKPSGTIKSKNGRQIITVDVKAAVKHCRKSWDAEIEKRVDEIRSGKVKGILASEVFAKIKAKYH
jgi:hypothetical protein